MEEKTYRELRDQMALAILPAILIDTGQLKHGYGGCTNILYRDCELAYKIADAMLDAREGVSYYNGKARVKQ